MVQNVVMMDLFMLPLFGIIHSHGGVLVDIEEECIEFLEEQEVDGLPADMVEEAEEVVDEVEDNFL
jgi:hypothetical protein